MGGVSRAKVRSARSARTTDRRNAARFSIVRRGVASSAEPSITRKGEPGLSLRQLLHVGAEPFVFVRDRIEEQTLGHVLPALLVGHVFDDVLDLAHHGLERT